MNVRVTDQPFDPWSEVQNRQNNRSADIGSIGATAVFVGTMRDFNEGDAVQGMFLEHYPGMTERYLEKICADASARWDLLDILIVHRVGELHPTDPIVLVAVWPAHRKDAFEASRWLMAELKLRAPVLKERTAERR